MSEIKGFYKEYENMFEEYLEDTIGNLKNKNEKNHRFGNSVINGSIYSLCSGSS